MCNWWTALLVTCLFGIVTCKNHKVSVTLQANWAETSLLAEISEYVAEESLESFWSFVDLLEPLVISEKWQTWLAKSIAPGTGLDLDIYLLLEDLALTALSGQNTTESSVVLTNRQLIRLFTSTRSYSPAVEMAHQAALATASQLLNSTHQDIHRFLKGLISGTAWAQVGNTFVYDLDALRSTLKSVSGSETNSTPILREKVFRSTLSAAPSSPRIILYGDLGQKDFYSWHKQLKSLTDDGMCTYVFRHYMKERPQRKSMLSGYGVELALKSTEYKAMDDTTVEENGSLTTTNETLDAVVQGFNFTQLYMLHPELTPNLKAFQEHLISTDDELHPLKVWQFRDLGLQASQVVVDAFRKGFQDTTDGKVNSGLLALKDVSQNLPARASRLVSLNVDPAIRDEILANHELLSSMGIQPGQSALFINGLLLSPTVDIFALLDLLRREYKTLSRLHNLGVSNDLLTELLIVGGSSEQTTSNSNEPLIPGLKHSLSGRFVLDLSNSPILFVNNLEMDPAYAYWSDSLHSLFVPDFSGGIRRLRKNLYNVILVVDPASSDCWEIFRLVESFLLHKTAVRFGFLWSIESSVKSSSLILVRIVSYISSTITHPNQSPLPTSVPGLGSPGPMAALSFLTELYASMERSGEELNLSMIQRWFEKLFPNAYIEDIFNPEPGESDYDSELKLHEAFLHRSGLDTVGRKPLMLFNGIIFDQAGIQKMGGFEDSVVALCMEELVRVQYAVYHGRMSITDSIFAMYQKSGVIVTRFNPRILSARISDNNLGQQFLEFGREQPVWPKVGTEPTVSQLLTHFVDHMRYFQKGDLESALRPITVWIIVGDLDAIFINITDDAHRQQVLHDFKLAHAAITYLRSAQSSKGLRIGFVHNPSTDLTEPLHSKRGDRWLTRLLYLIAHPIQVPAERSSTRHDRKSVKFVEQMSARNFANRLLKEAVDSLKSGHPYPPLSELVVSGVDAKLLENALREMDYEAFLHHHSVFCRRVLGLKPGERAAVVNGRIIGPLGLTEDLIVDDLRLLEKVAVDMKATQLADSLSKMIGDKLSGLEAVSELTWQVASILHPSDDVPSSSITDTDTVEGILSKSRIGLTGLSFKHSGFQILAPLEQPTLELLAIVNPTSRETQRLSHVLTVLQQSLSCNMKVSLNPVLSLSELPLKNFYRFVWEPALFDFESSTGKAAISPDPVTPRAEFVHLPGQPLLTLGMDAPHGWMVAAVEAVHDLDNLRLVDAHSTVEALFELEYLLLEGHCFEEGSMKPPRGLQLTLGPASDLGRYDTIVMANLGYFQLKAGPGIWHLNIRPGRSRDLYTMIDDDDTGTHVNSTDLVINFNSFRSKIITVRVKKHPGRDNENLVDETESPSSLTTRDSWAWLYKNSDVWATLSNYAETLCPTWLTSLRKSLQAHLPWQTCTNKQETINVFSLASGHLYERLLRIMMLTVIRHTKSPVKFWFLKNYLSPTFKDFIPHMAAEYGFDYELVQYQWPRWLHAQTEKQRIIWGYKILFLDVLFPLNVTKIIFVDADQIVRADLQELADYDLQGAPYGYTPFCDSRKEMDGFRFWKQGYWASHLAGRPYTSLHSAGDRLRGQYHGLSQDPNSLSNLDQDLPNNMIHQVPIKSLPQEWLWCETWCSDESKAHAKTIDLCNNPQTKEPKLSAAMRIAPEWVDYDREIKRLWRRIYPPQKPKSETIQTVPEIVQESDSAEIAPPAGGHCTTDCAASGHPFGSMTPAQSVATPPQKREKQIERAEL
ncbi:hypothetical protein AHF37_03007 [Paragonimus kellicotti]|nr:hypothetical protein AHF37_03007 [Paragonimus kellicotti]